VIGGLRGLKTLILVVHKRESLLIYAILYTGILNGMDSTLVSCLHATPQSLFPKTANAIVFAPLLHHPSLEFVLDGFPLIDFRRRILLLATLCLGLLLKPLDLKSQALLIEPRCEVLKHDRIIQENLLVPRWRSHVISDRRGLDGLSNLRKD
jgi:hypothetical protein